MCFAEDYPKEFSHIFHKREIVESPTVYVCAQDRSPNKNPDGLERLLILINAPAMAILLISLQGERILIGT